MRATTIRPTRLLQTATAAALVSIAAASYVMAGERVHFSDFDENVGEGWSTKKIETPPNAKATRFLGRFAGNESAKLALEGLPEHTHLKLSFDLHIIQSWDGTNRSWGPDRWKLHVDGRVLLDTVFRNEEEETGSLSGQQHYPALLPGELNKHKTGATAIDRLGYKRTDGVKDTSPDATYKMTFTIPHTAPKATIVFAGINLQEVGDESWGIDNVSVELLSADDIKPIDDEAWGALWKALEAKTPFTGYAAAWALIGHGDETVDRMRKAMLGPDSGLAAQRRRIEALIEKLNDDSFAEREKATKALMTLWHVAPDLIDEALKNATSPEVEWRLKRVKASRDKTGAYSPATLRQRRALKVLEIIGTEKANALLAQVDPSKRPTKQPTKAGSTPSRPPTPAEAEGPAPTQPLEYHGH